MFPNPNNRKKKSFPASNSPIMPNGTWYAQERNNTYIPRPENAVYGPQGQPYAMLPQVNVGQTSYGGNLASYFSGFNNPTKGHGYAVPGGTTAFGNLFAGWNSLFNNPNAQSTAGFGTGTVPYGQIPGGKGLSTPGPGGGYRPPAYGGSYDPSNILPPQNAAPVGYGNNVSPVSQPQFGPGPSSYNAYSESLLTRLAQGEDPSNFSQAEQDTMERILAGQGQGQPPNPNQPYGGYTNTGGGKYADTASAQYYAAAGTPFEQQMTYINGKRMKIGDAIRKGLLDVKTGQRFNQPMKRNRKGRLVQAERATGSLASKAPMQQGPMPSFGVINMSLNTGTG